MKKYFYIFCSIIVSIVFIFSGCSEKYTEYVEVPTYVEVEKPVYVEIPKYIEVEKPVYIEKEIEKEIIAPCTHDCPTIEVVLKEPTCSSKGELGYKCGYCKNFLPEYGVSSIEPNGHSYIFYYNAETKLLEKTCEICNIKTSHEPKNLNCYIQLTYKGSKNYSSNSLSLDIYGGSHNYAVEIRSVRLNTDNTGIIATNIKYWSSYYEAMEYYYNVGCEIDSGKDYFIEIIDKQIDYKNFILIKDGAIIFLDAEKITNQDLIEVLK